MHCDVGYYLSGCGVVGPGVCVTCRRDCKDAPGHYLIHDREEGCRNEYTTNSSDLVVYLAGEDYRCVPCHNSRRTVFGTYELLVGCAG